jgi:hypothetical protein
MLQPDPPLETTAAYLRRVLPDFVLIEGAVLAAIGEPQGRRYSLSTAIAKTGKLFDDLVRAERSDKA